LSKGKKIVSKALGLLPQSVNKRIRLALGSKVVEQDGLKWYVTYDTRYGYALSRDQFESDLNAVILDNIHPGDTFLDVGAGAGKYSLLAAKKKDGAKVYSWEPNPYNRSIFMKNIELNGIKTITLYDAALSDHDGTGRFRLSALASKITQEEGGAETIELKLSTLDSYEIANASFVKIDVEGHESNVLKGASRTVARCKPTLLIELHPHIVPDTRKRCSAILETFGYGSEDVPNPKGGRSEYILARPKKAT
jgi:FkbM family methyltransferase